MAVQVLFDEVRPRGSTPTAIRLDELLRPYLEHVEDMKAARLRLPKPTVVIVRMPELCSMINGLMQ